MPGRLSVLVLAVIAGLLAGGGGVHLLARNVAYFGQRDAGEAWVESGRASPKAWELLTLLRQAEADGLDQSRYSVSEIERELARSGDAGALRRADRLLSDAYAAYSRDLRVPRAATDVTYVDAELAPAAVKPGNSPVSTLKGLQDLNPTYRELRRGLERYRTQWSSLPQIPIPAGPSLTLGSRGDRVGLLQSRLGLPRSDVFDERLAEKVSAFRQVHGLGASPVADAATIGALNLGASHYLRLIALNLDRARGLPVDGRRHIVVDVAGARLRMIEGGREVGSMRVIVGRRGMETPPLAGFIRFAVLNPYWNIPPDLVRHSVAPEVLREGTDYLVRKRYALFSDWRESAVSLEPSQVDWNGVAAGLQKVWIRQLPGGDNMMGEIKFMLPNRLGIYLHDTPRKADFARDDRHLSSGCVRVEDAHRLARWIFGSDPLAGNDAAPEKRVDLPQPVPVYITYLTAVGEAGEIRFQHDAYGRDPALLARLTAKP